jgi:hypothetical protein
MLCAALGECAPKKPTNPHRKFPILELFLANTLFTKPIDELMKRIYIPKFL